MVVDQLLADLLVHASQGVVGSGEVTGQLGEGALHQALNSEPLVLGDAGGKTEAIDGTSDPDTGGVDGHFRLNIVTCFATRECTDLMTGNSPDMMRQKERDLIREELLFPLVGSAGLSYPYRIRPKYASIKDETLSLTTESLMEAIGGVDAKKTAFLATETRKLEIFYL